MCVHLGLTVHLNFSKFIVMPADQNHFADSTVSGFALDFLNPLAHDPSLDQTYDEWEEEDDLGYYEDGVKRTLTDEQIAIFRHSELRELRRQREKGSQGKGDTSKQFASSESNYVSPKTDDASPLSSSRNRKKKRKSKNSKPEPKPDLRKRTWDVVEAGLDTLDYD